MLVGVVKVKVKRNEFCLIGGKKTKGKSFGLLNIYGGVIKFCNYLH